MIHRSRPHILSCFPHYCVFSSTYFLPMPEQSWPVHAPHLILSEHLSVSQRSTSGPGAFDSSDTTSDHVVLSTLSALASSCHPITQPLLFTAVKLPEWEHTPARVKKFNELLKSNPSLLTSTSESLIFNLPSHSHAVLNNKLRAYINVILPHFTQFTGLHPGHHVPIFKLRRAASTLISTTINYHFSNTGSWQVK